MRMVGEFDVNAVHKFLMGYRMCVPGCLLLCLAFREPFSLQIRREDNIFCVFLSISFMNFFFWSYYLLSCLTSIHQIELLAVKFEFQGKQEWY